MSQVALYPLINNMIDALLLKLEKENNIIISKEAFCNLILAYALTDEENVKRLAMVVHLLELKGVSRQTSSQAKKKR